MVTMERATLSKRCCVRCTQRKSACLTSEDSDRCLECVKRGVDCSLAPINVPRWKRLEERRKQLRRELSEAHAKSVRILTELDSIEADQERMVEKEVENLEAQEKEEEKEKGSAASSLSPNADLSSVFDAIDFSCWDPSNVDFGSGTAPASQGN